MRGKGLPSDFSTYSIPSTKWIKYLYSILKECLCVVCVSVWRERERKREMNHYFPSWFHILRVDFYKLIMAINTFKSLKVPHYLAWAWEINMYYQLIEKHMLLISA